MDRPDKYSLSNDLQGDLVWYWQEADSALGVRSNTGNQIQMLQARSMPEPPRGQPGAALERWRLGGPEERAQMRRERWEREDQAARDVFQTIDVKKGSAGDCTRYGVAFSEMWGEAEGLEVTYEPDWARIAGAAAAVRQRSRRVWGTLQRMKVAPRGVHHEFVLFRTYGPKTNLLQESKAIAKDKRGIGELAPLFEYTQEIERRFVPGMDRRRVLELALRKPSEALTRALCEQARDLLSDASEAYSLAHERETGEHKQSKRKRFAEMMAAA